MESSTDDQSRKSHQMTFEDFPMCISSQELEVGPLLSGSQDGRTIGQSAPAPVPVNHFPQRASKRRKPTKDISGRLCSGSSKSQELTFGLANRLLQRLGMGGLMEYAEIWKERITPSGRSYLEHTASARRTSDRDSTGWPTPASQNADGGPNPLGNTGEHFTLQTAAGMAGWPSPKTPTGGACPDGADHGGKRPRQTPQHVEKLVGWNTPRATDGTNGGPNQAGALPADAAMTGLATPTTRDWKDGHQADAPTNALLGRQVWGVSGEISESSTVSTESRGVLDAAFSRWLMGFPVEWDLASPNFQAWSDVQDLIESGG